ncbi:integrase catalytic domain-containing protein [Nephila pilipes]|uniref:Integrase catalytic domain-containing protein n=1 Tax=Nephila pilipes TaxID=299642 RepID=A0A8X6KGS5_NEPPI|nr:integrase catalytic domain-containing protein [Nephila pilipes]GFT44209.1 integrase catalytic domain-containing protein [Nephila pilipes]GFT45777.1 integrase catalytic domain-containing protein [Nephila pilipes]
MNLKGLGEESVNHGLFRGIERAEKYQRYHINLSNVDVSYNCELKALDEKKICASLPRVNDDNCLKQLKDIGTLVIEDSSEKRSKTKTQQFALKHLRETVSRGNTGRYKMNLPSLEEYPPLHDNKEFALKRIRNTVRSLK